MAVAGATAVVARISIYTAMQAWAINSRLYRFSGKKNLAKRS
jgi:hypothetical protein